MPPATVFSAPLRRPPIDPPTPHPAAGAASGDAALHCPLCAIVSTAHPPVGTASSRWHSIPPAGATSSHRRLIQPPGTPYPAAASRLLRPGTSHPVGQSNTEQTGSKIERRRLHLWLLAVWLNPRKISSNKLVHGLSCMELWMEWM